MAVNGTGAGNVAAAAAAVGRRGRLRLHRLRLRRRQGRALRRDRPAGSALRLRPHQAGRRGGDRGRQPAPLRRPLLLALRDRRHATSSRRCCASPPTTNEVLVVRDQVGSPTYTWHLAYGIVRLIEGIEYGIHHMAAAGAVLLVRVRPRDLRAGQGRVQSALGDHRDARPPRAAPALLGAGQPARARDRAALAGRTGWPATSPSDKPRRRPA